MPNTSTDNNSDKSNNNSSQEGAEGPPASASANLSGFPGGPERVRLEP